LFRNNLFSSKKKIHAKKERKKFTSINRYDEIGTIILSNNAPISWSVKAIPKESFIFKRSYVSPTGGIFCFRMKHKWHYFIFGHLWLLQFFFSIKSGDIFFQKKIVPPVPLFTCILGRLKPKASKYRGPPAKVYNILLTVS